MCAAVAHSTLSSPCACRPTLLSGHAIYPKVLLASAVMMTSVCFDMLCSDAFTEHHALGVLATFALLVGFAMPFYLLVYEQVARLVLLLRERCGCPVVPAYAAGMLLNNVALLAFFVSFVLAGPSTLFEPGYHLPQDGGLDPIGRKVLATEVVMLITVFGVLAVAGTFKL